MTITTVSSEAIAAKQYYAGAQRDLQALEQHIDIAHQNAETLRADRTLTHEFKQQRLAQIREALIERAHQDRADISDRLQAAERQANIAIAGRQDDPVVETRKNRAVTRVARLLNSGRHITEIAEVFRGAGDLDALRTLRDEVPAYVASIANERDDTAAMVRDLTLSIDRAMRPLLPEDEQVAVDVRLGAADNAALLDALMQYALRFDQLGGNDSVTLARDIANARTHW